MWACLGRSPGCLKERALKLKQLALHWPGQKLHLQVEFTEGYYEPNEYDAYTLNNITVKKDADGSISVQFGGCDGKVANCLPIMPGWNYMVRLYRPRKEILDGTFRFPEAQPV